MLLVSCLACCWLSMSNTSCDDKVTEQFSLNNTFNDDFIRIEGGTYIMGCKEGRDTDCFNWERPPHQVVVDTFYLSKYEVTQAQWRQVMGSDPERLYNRGCDQCPVEGISWKDVEVFLQKLNIQTGLSEQQQPQKYRLPTEAEWEYAARGGNISKGYLYSGSNDLAEVAWYFANSRKDNNYGTQKTTRPVGGKKPNELGLYDMTGNVWEFCSDWYEEYQDLPQQNPSGPESGSYRVHRGGCWRSTSELCDAPSRHVLKPALSDITVGFRLARSR